MHKAATWAARVTGELYMRADVEVLVRWAETLCKEISPERGLLAFAGSAQNARLTFPFLIGV